MTQNDKRLALITGASGGIGEAFAHRVARQGYDLVLVARSESALERVRSAIAGQTSATVHLVALDLTAQGAVSTLSNEIAARLLAPDVVINNAGFGLTGKAAELPLADQLNMIDLNVRALTELTLLHLPQMLARRRGGIINVASVAAFLPGPNMAVYFATKAYVVSFSDALYEEVKGSGVTITSVCPGPVETGFQARAGMKDVRRLSSAGLVSAETVAAEGWSAFLAGERQVIPGLANKLVAYATRGAPRRALLPFAARAMAKSKA
jgi:hypothetical protein